MALLTCGERTVRCLLGQPIDHTPFGTSWGGWAPWDAALARWRAESGDPDLDLQQYFGFEADFAVPEANCWMQPCFEYQVLEETEEHIVIRDGSGITQRGRRNGMSMPQFLDYPVKTRADWERIKEERLQPEDPSRITEEWSAFRARIQTTGEAVEVIGGSVFGNLRQLMGAEGALICFHTDPQLVHDIMEHLTTLSLAVWEKAAAEVQIDRLNIWEDMAGKQGSLISPRMVEEFMMPQYDRIAAFARKVGTRIISVDTDGDCRELVPIMMKHGVNLIFPFEVQAGNDIRQYRQQYPALGIIGGLNKYALAKTKADIDREIAKAAWMVESGRYIPSFDHAIPPDVPWENFCYAAEEIKKICYGTHDAKG